MKKILSAITLALMIIPLSVSAFATAMLDEPVLKVFNIAEKVDKHHRIVRVFERSKTPDDVSAHSDDPTYSEIKAILLNLLNISGEAQ